MMYCPDCGKEIPDNSKFCPKCGAQIEAADKQSVPAQGTLDNTASHKTSAPEAAGATSLEQNAAEPKKSSIPLYLWPLVMVLLQAAGIVVGLMVLLNPAGTLFSPGTWIAAALMGLGLVLVPIIDLFYLSSIGVRGAWKWSVLILPLYLFIRASKTNRKYLLPVLYLVLIAAGIVLSIVGPSLMISNYAEETGSAGTEILEAIQDGEPVTYADLAAAADLDVLEMPWEGDVAIVGIVTEVTTQELLDQPIPTYIVAAEGETDQLIEVVCMEGVPVPAPEVGDFVVCDGAYMGAVSRYPRILGTVFWPDDADDAEDAITAAASSPSAAAPTSASSPSTKPAQDFTLTREQADNLAEEVARPILLTEWYATMTGTDYNESIWRPEFTKRVEDYTGRTVAGDVDTGMTLWAEYMLALRDALMNSQLEHGSTSSIFETGAYTTNAGGESRLVIESPALTAYFQEAFGNGALADNVRSLPETSIAATPDGDVEMAFSDDAYMLTMNIPTTPVNVEHGQVTFTGYIISDAPWVAAPLEITLQVEQADNAYGCHVTGYSVGAAPESILPPELIAAMHPPAAPPQTNGGSFDANGFVFADSSDRYLTMDELAGLSKEMLGYARNEIFARNGNLFRTDKYIDHYNSYDWYRNMSGKRYDVEPTDLNPIEQANVNLIREREAQLP